MYKTIRLDDTSGDFILRQKEPRLVLQIFDISQLDTRQEIDFKKNLAAYSTTHANGRDMLLTIHAIHPDDAPAIEHHNNPGQVISDLLLEAADYVHDAIINVNN